MKYAVNSVKRVYTLYYMQVQRLNYIGSKHQLIDWIIENIMNKTKWTSLDKKVIGDLFAGTGVVTWNFRNKGAITVSNDAELYSYYITKAFARTQWSEKLKNIIDSLNNSKDGLVGFVTRNFSPWEESERMFFTVENAQRIDWVRQYIENIRTRLSEEEYVFLVASLVVSADSVSNVPAVYGMYLKNFKDKAKKKLVIRPIHTNETLADTQSQVFNNSVLHVKFPKMDAVYLDPPYNNRQYSKNYFPLNIIAMTPDAADEQKLHGKTGIPDDSFISSFCQKKTVEQSFETLVKSLEAQWIFISYNSESLIPKDRMIQILSKYGETGVEEMDYKRFKSFNYNNGDSVTEYLFFLCKSI